MSKALPEVIQIVVKALLREGFYSDIVWAVWLDKPLLPAEVYICRIDCWKDISTCSFVIFPAAVTLRC